MGGTDFVIRFDVQFDFFAGEGTNSAAKRVVSLGGGGVGGETNLIFMIGFWG